MFLIYADDIVEGLECDIHLYADDAVLITNYIAPEEAYAKLNRDLQRLESWATKWFMSFNPAKTKYMVIAGHDQPHPHLMFNDVILEEVSTYPQLGLVLNNRLTWEDHINSAILKANKKIGLIWRLRNEMPRYITEKIYTHYIRPQLEYGSLLYDDSTQELTHRLEQCQRQAAIACTGAYRRTNTDALLKEVGWPKLESRRKYNSLVMMYKISHHMVPSYLTELLPLRQGRHHQTRNEETYTPIRSRTERHKKSLMPSMVRRWNALDQNIRTLPTISRFKRALQKSMFSTRSEHLSRVKGRASIAHTRMRLGLSPLKQQLHSHGIIESPICTRCDTGESETVTHYLLKCDRYEVHRHNLMSSLQPVMGGLKFSINNTHMLIELLLNGSSDLNTSDNTLLFETVQRYLDNTKLF